MQFYGDSILAGGYYIANKVQRPLEALALFFVAVVLVITGTYNLFLAGSILLLKLLRKNKNYHYKTNHFISVSSMIYRMKQNAAGLSSICILATAVLVMISGTLSLYLGMDDALKTRNQNGVTINSFYSDADKTVAMASAAQDKIGATRERETFYPYVSLWGEQQGEHLEYIPLTDQNNEATTIINTLIIPLEEYNQMSGTNFQLEEGEILLGTDGIPYEDDSLQLYGLPFVVKAEVDLKFRPDNIMIAKGARYLVIVEDIEVLSTLHQAFLEHPLNIAPSKYQLPSEFQIMYFYGFDLSDTDDELAVYHDILSSIKKEKLPITTDCREEGKNEMMEMYGGFLFLGLFLSVLFLIATTLIIYYKQITEGYDDKIRYNIMLKVGLSKKEIKQTINSQMLLTFFLPLIMASIHILAAFKVIGLMLNLLFLYNTSLFALCTLGTILAFSVAYVLIYRATSAVYYRIVAEV